jgi:hypothetical protein
VMSELVASLAISLCTRFLGCSFPELYSRCPYSRPALAVVLRSLALSALVRPESDSPGH